MATKNKGWKSVKGHSELLRDGEGGTFYARVKHLGKQRWKSLETDLKSVALLKLPKFKVTLAAEEELKKKKVEEPKGPTVGQYIDLYLKDLPFGRRGEMRAESSQKRLRNAVLALVDTWPDLKDREIAKTRLTDCEDWVKSQRSKMSGSSINKCMEALRGSFKLAIKSGDILVNPLSEMPGERVPTKVIEPPGKDVLEKLVVLVGEAGSRHSAGCADMVRLLLLTGCRLEEANSLTWGDVDPVRNTLHIRGTKSDSSDRYIPIFKPLADLLADLQKKRGVEKADAPISRVNKCKGALATACKVLGIKRLTHHDLRHLFATRCIEAGVDIPTIAKWLGHSDGGALLMRTYTHIANEHSHAQAAKITF